MTFNWTRCIGFLVMFVPLGLLGWAIFDEWTILPCVVAYAVFLAYISPPRSKGR